MLHNETFKRLREHNWLEIKKNDSNPSQTIHRIKVNAERSVQELGLLADKVPDAIQEDVFTADNMGFLISKILKVGGFWVNGVPSSHSGRLEARRTQISARLIKKCTGFCILQIQMLFPETRALLEPTIKQLRQSVAICDDIANQIELKEVRDIGRERNLELLFNWDEITREGNLKLQNYLYTETDLTLGVTNLKKSRNGNSITCKLVLEKKVIYFLQMTLNEKTNHVDVIITDVDNNNKQYRRKLFVMKQNNINYIYRKINV